MSKLYLKVKIKSLAEEAKIIRKEEKKAHKNYLWEKSPDQTYPDSYYEWLGLRSHRKSNVRNESRAALLAYGYLRGKKFSEIEKNSTVDKKIYSIHTNFINFWNSHNSDFRLWVRVARLIFKYNRSYKTFNKIQGAYINDKTQMMHPKDLHNWVNEVNQ